MSAQSRGMTPARFRDAVRKGQLFDVVLLRGSEDYLLREVLREYIAAAMPAAAADFDRSDFRGPDVEPRTFYNAVTTLPLMASRRLVILEITSELGSDLAAAVQRYIERPAATTSLVLVVVHTESARRGSDVRLPGSFAQVDFAPLKDDDRIAWAIDFVRARGKTLLQDAADYLIKSSSSSLADIAAKLEHAVLFGGDEQEINELTLQRVAGVSSEYTSYKLEDAILAGQCKEALLIAQSLLDGREPLLRLLAFHRTLMMRLWQFKWLMIESDKKSNVYDRRELEQQILGRQSFKINDFKRATGRYSLSSIQIAVQGLLEVEINAKTRTDEPHRYYEWLHKFTASARVS